MAFIVLTSCNVRKGIQTLIGQEVQKQLLPSKTIQQNSENCLVSFEDVDAEIDEDDFNPQELIMEGFANSMGLFLLSWTLIYTYLWSER